MLISKSQKNVLSLSQCYLRYDWSYCIWGSSLTTGYE